MKLAVIGVGLIGGSFALALKQAKQASHVVGVGRNAANLKLALERGIIDSIAPDPATAARGADLVLISTPVAQFAGVFSGLAVNLDAKTLVTDGGSTKRDVIAAARKALGKEDCAVRARAPDRRRRKERGRGGERGAVPRQARGADSIGGKFPSRIFPKSKQAWKICGASVSRMDAGEHDAVLAAVSHLPHLLAFALVHDVAQRPELRTALLLRRRRLPRFHAHRLEPPGDVARYLRGEPGPAARRGFAFFQKNRRHQEIA